MSVLSTNPAALFGGTWVAWGEGQVPVGVKATDSDFDTVEKTGGSKTSFQAHSHSTPAHTHTTGTESTGHLHGFSGTTAADSHDHTFWYKSQQCASGTSSTFTIPDPYISSSRNYIGNESHSHTFSGTTGDIDRTHTHSIASSGGGTSGNAGQTGSTNLQPYITCYMWKRTA